MWLQPSFFSTATAKHRGRSVRKAMYFLFGVLSLTTAGTLLCVLCAPAGHLLPTHVGLLMLGARDLSVVLALALGTDRLDARRALDQPAGSLSRGALSGRQRRQKRKDALAVHTRAVHK